MARVDRKRSRECRNRLCLCRLERCCNRPDPRHCGQHLNECHGTCR